MQTLPHKAASRSGPNSEDRALAKSQPELPSVHSVLTRRVCLTLANYGMLALTSISIAGILPLFFYTPVELGGLGFSEAQVQL